MLSLILLLFFSVKIQYQFSEGTLNQWTTMIHLNNGQVGYLDPQCRAKKLLIEIELKNIPAVVA